MKNLIREWTDDYHPAPVLLWVLALALVVFLVVVGAGYIPKEDTVKDKLDRIEAKLDAIQNDLQRRQPSAD